MRLGFGTPTMPVPTALHTRGSREGIPFSRIWSHVQVGREGKGMGEPGHHAGDFGHLSDLSQDMLEWGLGQLNSAMGQSRVIPAPLGVTATELTKAGKKVQNNPF